MTISVVMPVHNEVSFIRAAVQSILQQTYSEFELVIVDDASTDGTAEFVDKIGDPRVRTIHPGRVGFLRALELGVREARGDWIARMDADDLAHPQRFQVELTFLREHSDCLFVSCQYGIVTPSGRYLLPRRIFDWQYVTPRMLTLGAESLFADPGTIFNRRQALSVGLYDPVFENEKPLYYKLLTRGAGAVLGRCLHLARWRLGTHSQSRHKQRLTAYFEIRERYDKENVPGPADRLEWMDEGDAAVSAARSCCDYYIVARDFRAARRVALRTLRDNPLSSVAPRLLLKSILRRRSLRFWQPDEGHRRFLRAEKPW